MGASQLPGKKAEHSLKLVGLFCVICHQRLRYWFEEVMEGSRRVGGGYHTGKTSSQISSASAAICYSIRE